MPVKTNAVVDWADATEHKLNFTQVDFAAREWRLRQKGTEDSLMKAGYLRRLRHMLEAQPFIKFSLDGVVDGSHTPDEPAPQEDKS